MTIAREIARGLTLALSGNDNLCVALEALAAGTREHFGVECLLRSGEARLTLGDFRALHLYRIAQEAINNAIRHGKAAHLIVTISQVGDWGILTVQDDGSGMPDQSGSFRWNGPSDHETPGADAGRPAGYPRRSHTRSYNQLLFSRGTGNSLPHPMTLNDPGESRKRIFLVDDHPLVREWLGHLINRQTDLALCGEAQDASDAMREIRRRTPDAVVVDISLRGSSGIELIVEIKLAFPKVAILVLSMHEESTYVERALRAGAIGYVAKRETTTKIVSAIRQVLRGEYSLSGPLALAMTRKYVETPARAGLSPAERLSNRELEIFAMLGRGFETRRIAEELHISMKTVQAYCARIKEKLHLNSATELLREAILWDQRDKSTG